MITRAEKLAEIERMIVDARAAAGRGDAYAARNVGILQAIAEDYRRPAVTLDAVMDALERHINLDGEVHGPVITGIATAAEAIMALMEGRGE